MTIAMSRAHETAKHTNATKKMNLGTIIPCSNLLTELRGLIGRARQYLAQAANSTLTLLYWHVGRRVHRNILTGQCASNGEEILPTLSTQSLCDYGQGFRLHRMVQFFATYSVENIVATMSQQLNWRHFVEILLQDKTLQRDFHADMSHNRLCTVRVG
jgi:DUF1016 N-terminal domain